MAIDTLETGGEREFFEAVYGEIIYRGPGPVDELQTRVIELAEADGHFEETRHKEFVDIPTPLPLVWVRACPNPAYQTSMILRWNRLPRSNSMADKTKDATRPHEDQGQLFDTQRGVVVSRPQPKQ